MGPVRIEVTAIDAGGEERPGGCWDEPHYAAALAVVHNVIAWGDRTADAVAYDERNHAWLFAYGDGTSERVRIVS